MCRDPIEKGYNDTGFTWVRFHLPKIFARMFASQPTPPPPPPSPPPPPPSPLRPPRTPSTVGGTGVGVDNVDIDEILRRYGLRKPPPSPPPPPPSSSEIVVRGVDEPEGDEPKSEKAKPDKPKAEPKYFEPKQMHYEVMSGICWLLCLFLRRVHDVACDESRNALLVAIGISQQLPLIRLMALRQDREAVEYELEAAMRRHLASVDASAPPTAPLSLSSSSRHLCAECTRKEENDR